MSPHPDDRPQVLSRDGPCLCDRDHGLADVPDFVLKQLTKLLYMDSSNNVANPSQSWLDYQAEMAPLVDRRIRRPKNLFARLAVRIGEHGVRFFPQAARLCAAHHALDPRVIRSLMLLVGHECTLRTDRFRKWRGQINYSEQATMWLDRIDAITGLWIGREAFEMVFGYQRAMPGVQSVDSGCEACILAVIGSRPQLLCDLRASMLGRMQWYSKHQRREPRLLRIVDAWIMRYDEVTSAAIMNLSEMLAQDIASLFADIREHRETRKAIRSLEGKRPKKPTQKPRHHHYLKTKNGMPVPRNPSRGRYDTREDLSYYEYSTDSCSTHKSTTNISIKNQEKPQNFVIDDHPGHEAWGWLQDRMQNMTEEDRQTVLESVHPAFSDFGSDDGSAISWPLIKKKHEKGKDTKSSKVKKGSNDDDDGTWVSATVHTLGDDDDDDDTEASSSSDRDEANEGSEYVPARQAWTTKKTQPPNAFARLRNTTCRPGPPPSSVYSQASLPRGLAEPQQASFYCVGPDNESVEFTNPWVGVSRGQGPRRGSSNVSPWS